jgi:transcriptional regulator with XRE-family HTH domain
MQTRVLAIRALGGAVTQRSIAARQGFSEAGLSRIFTGRSEPTLEQLQKIARELAVDPMDLTTPIEGP